MSAKPDFAAINNVELRVYVLENRGDEEALHLYIDRLDEENPNSRIYGPDEDVAEAISEHLKSRVIKDPKAFLAFISTLSDLSRILLKDRFSAVC